MKNKDNIFTTGEVFIWLTGLGLGLVLVMIAGLLVLVFMKGSEYYLPGKLASITTKSNEKYLGEISHEEKIPVEDLPDFLKNRGLVRYKFKIGNRDIYGLDFKWFDKSEIVQLDYPKHAIAIERTEFGNFYGFLKQIKKNEEMIFEGFDEVNENLPIFLDNTIDIRNELSDLENNQIGDINYKIEQARLRIKKYEYEYKDDLSSVQEEISEIEADISGYQVEYEDIIKRVDSLNVLAKTYSLVLETAEGMEKEIYLVDIYRYYFPNNMGLMAEAGFITGKITEFLLDDPRESNTEGGVFPAIFGTVMMVILMSLAAVPFGIIGALYLREYAKQGAFVRTVRIAVNNLAGVPSIVFGVFGLGFFIYFVGGTIDKLFYPEVLPTPTWGTGGILWASLTLALLTVPVVIVSTEEALASIPRGIREASLALGSTKWQTIRRIVLPAAAPGVLTGVILAMARGAGEVAPLMITGVVKLAPNLPLDSYFPFFHLDRKFMHLGFHIYDVGFQSPNVEAALPMVYMTTLLLIFIVVLMNVSAMTMRTRLRKKYKASTF